MTTVEVGGAGLERLNRLLHDVPGGVWKAAYGALKRAGEAAKTQAGRFAAEEYTIRKSDFMKNVTVKTSIGNESGRGDVTAVNGAAAGGVVSLNIRYAGNVLPLLAFDTHFGRNGRLRVQVKRLGDSKPLNRAFAARVFDRMGVFEREGDARFPVRQLYGPSTAHMMRNERVVEKMDATIRETYEKRIDHEIDRVLNGWGGRT